MSLPRSLARTLAMARKEGLHIVRDSRSLAMALAVPVMMLVLFGYALTLDVDRIQTLVYDQDQTPQSRELIARFAGSRYFQMLGSVDEYRTIERAINRGRCLLAVVIPKDYGRHLLASQEADVQLLLDGSDSNTASITLAYADALGREVKPTPVRTGVKWMRFTTDIAVAATEIWHRRLSPGEYVKSLFGARDAVMWLSDPLPFLADVLLVPYHAKVRGF